MKATIEPNPPSSDARITVTGDDTETLAQADLWWKQTPTHNDSKTGTIGAFHATCQASTTLLLSTATTHLKSQGVHTAIGPMDQNTWQKHRFVIETNGRHPFLLEPENPTDFPTWWQQAGFTILSRYSSSVLPLDGSTAVSPAMKRRILSSGITIENLDPTHFEAELRSIHTISLKSFSNNFLYTPLDESDFISAYAKIRDHIDPTLVKLARREGELIAFVFGIPDLAALPLGEKPALIVKTLAVDPSAHAPGLGSLLVDELHLTGQSKGYTEAIHALQHESNTSLKITGRNKGTAFRKYALFSKTL